MRKQGPQNSPPLQPELLKPSQPPASYPWGSNLPPALGGSGDSWGSQIWRLAEGLTSTHTHPPP